MVMRINRSLFAIVFFFWSIPGAFALGIGEPAPLFDLPPLVSSEKAPVMGLSDFRGKVVLLNFWASWCGPCKEELPALELLYRKYRNQGFEVVGINIDQRKKNAERFLSDRPVTFPVLFDPEAKVIASYLARGMPSSFLIGRRGKIGWVKFGFSKNQIEMFEREIEKLLKESTDESIQ